MRRYGKAVAGLAGNAKFVFRILKHPCAPWSARIVAGCSTAYLISPVQLIPSFIPIIGQLDDVLVLYLGMKFINAVTPGWIREECVDADRLSWSCRHSLLPSVLGLEAQKPRV